MRSISGTPRADAAPGRRHPLRNPRTWAALVALLLAGSLAAADDGDADPTFSGDGRAWFAWPTTYQGADLIDITTRAVAALSDGSIVTAGRFETIGPDRFQAGAVVKFKANGTIDTTFGDAGWQLVHFEAQPDKDEVIGVFPSSGNTVLVVGYVESMSLPYERPGLTRLLANGALDTTFGAGGRIVIDAQPFGSGAAFSYRTAIQAPDGKVLLAGYCNNCGHGSFPDFMALRLNANGSVDTSFGNAGWVSFGRTDVDDHYLPEVANSIAVDTQGRVVLAGYGESFDDQDHQQYPLLVRTLPNGQLDTEFGDDGYVGVTLPGSFAIDAIAIDAYNDGIISAANITNTPGVTPAALLLRTRRDGSQDANFGSGGVVVFQLEEGVNLAALAVRRDRRITAAGWIDPNGAGTRDFFAARTHFTGALDTTFDGNGVNRYPFGFAADAENVPTAMVLSGERPVVAGLLTDPSPDPSEFATGVLRLQSDLIFKSGLEPGQ